MAALTAIGLGLGVASAGYGMYEKSQGQKKSEEGYAIQQQGYGIQAQAAQQQAGISKEQAASSVEYAGYDRDLNIKAASQSLAVSDQSHTLNQNIFAEQTKQEGFRRTAMEVDSRRTQLEIIRNQQRTRSLALATGVSQGASRGSGLQGGYGQISGQSGTNLVAAQQALYMGRSVFDSNANITQSNVAMNDLQNMYARQQADNQTAKANMAYNYATVNAGYQTRLADTQTLNSQGQGLVNQGGGLANLGNQQSASGGQFISGAGTLFSAGQTANTVFPSLANYFK